MTGRSGGAAREAVAAWESLFRAQSELFRGFSQSPVWHGRTMREYDVLYQLSLAPEAGMRQRDLTDRLLISQPSLSRMIDRMVDEGLIDRSPDPRDGRGAMLCLTADGRALQRRIGAGHASDVAKAMRGRLSDAELVQLRQLTDRLTGADGPRDTTGGTRS